MFNDRSESRSAEEEQYDECAALAFRGSSQLAAERWQWIQGQLSEPAGALSVLDVGCGEGEFLRVAAASGSRVAGIEIDPAAVKRCHAAGLNVVAGSLFDVEIPAGPWRLITLWDVLDHLEHPVEALRRLTDLLEPGGLLVVRGRNARIHAPLKSVYRRHSGVLTRAGVPDVSVVHRWGFDRNGYISLLRQSGLRDIHTYASVPTAGDRYGAFRSTGLASGLKRVASTATHTLHRGSGGRVYPFASVLVTGSRPK